MIRFQEPFLIFTLIPAAAPACRATPGLLASKTTPLGTVSYTYATIGRRNSMTVGSQLPAYYGYDSIQQQADQSELFRPHSNNPSKIDNTFHGY